MEIKYKKKHLNLKLILGLVWLILFLVGVFVKEESNWTDYGWIVISVFYLGKYFYQKNYKYLTIENGIINVNGPFGKKLILTEIKRIKKFAGDYILKTDEKELTINTQIIDPNSLAELNAELEKLNVEWN
jgi:hypothetical protein